MAIKQESLDVHIGMLLGTVLREAHRDTASKAERKKLVVKCNSGGMKEHMTGCDLCQKVLKPTLEILNEFLYVVAS